MVEPRRSPIIGGVPQVIFGGGDGWLYSFKADEGKDGKPELLWKFDINPKDTDAGARRPRHAERHHQHAGRL